MSVIHEACGVVMTYYSASKTYYCPKSKGGCGAYGSAGQVALPSPCLGCGTLTVNERCRSCAAMVSRCRQCDETARHSHLSIRVCRYETCGRDYVTRWQATPDRERQFCSDRCNRNQKKLEYNRRRKAALRSASKTERSRKGRLSFDRVTLEKLVQQGYRCSYCDELVDLTLDYRDAMALTVDHTVSLAEGGSDSPDNLTAMHRACNSRKGWRRGDTQEVA